MSIVHVFLSYRRYKDAPAMLMLGMLNHYILSGERNKRTLMATLENKKIEKENTSKYCLEY
jgi:hypothetical protein